MLPVVFSQPRMEHRTCVLEAPVRMKHLNFHYRIEFALSGHRNTPK